MTPPTEDLQGVVMLQKGEPFKILVVDDELSMRELLEILLLKHGYDVRCAQNGSQAIEAIRSAPPTWL